MPSPPSAATNDIIEKLNAGVPASELAKKYSPSMVYRHLHKLKDGGGGSAVTNPPPPPANPMVKAEEPPKKPVEEPPPAKGEAVRNPPPKGSHKIVTPGGGSVTVTRSITPLPQGIVMKPRVLEMGMPVFLETAYNIVTTEWGWPKDMRVEDLIDTIFGLFFKDYGWILGPGAFHIEDLKELQGLRYLNMDTGERTPVAEGQEVGGDGVDN